MHQRLAAFAIAGAALLPDVSSAQTAEDAFGVWRHPENGSHVEMYKCSENLCAKIVKVVDTQKTDDKNPDASRRGRPVVGLVIMSGAKKTDANSWAGSIYNRVDGGTYSGTITVKSKDALDLAGCTAVILCKTLTWTRVK
jgi:uncharacterized protein (DUF2147 family)